MKTQQLVRCSRSRPRARRVIGMGHLCSQQTGWRSTSPERTPNPASPLRCRAPALPLAPSLSLPAGPRALAWWVEGWRAFQRLALCLEAPRVAPDGPRYGLLIIFKHLFCAQLQVVKAADAKEIVFDTDSRRRLQLGINKVADAVAVTLGPRGAFTTGWGTSGDGCWGHA